MSITKRRFEDNSSPYSITLDLNGNYIRSIYKMIKGWKFKNSDQLWGFLKNKYERPFRIILESLTCDCQDFAVKLYNKQDDYNLDLTQAICSAPPNLRNRSFSSISIYDMVCDITNNCPLNCSCTDQPSKQYMMVNCTDVGLTDLLRTCTSSATEQSVWVQLLHSFIKKSHPPFLLQGIHG